MATNRYGNLPEDNTGRQITQQHENEAFAATIGVAVTGQRTTIVIAQMTGAATLNVTEDLAVGALQEGDELVVITSADASSRTLTLGTKLKGANLVLLANESGIIKGHYDGTDFVMATLVQTT